MNPEKRRLVRKTILELCIIVRYLVKLRSEDILFVSCLLPTTLLLVEFANRFLRRSGVFVVLHGEAEGLFAPGGGESFRRIGYWALTWIRFRTRESQISVVVLDDFIRDRLVQKYSEKLSSGRVWVIRHPAFPIQSEVAKDSRSPTVCFVGYRTKFKGFDTFRHLATRHASVKFVAIGAGRVEDMTGRAVSSLSGKNAYFAELSKCAVAVFPCTAGYSATISAAALDALAAGLEVIALDQPFFRSLASRFGAETVTVCTSTEQLSRELCNKVLAFLPHEAVSRLRRVLESPYGPGAVQKAFEQLVFENRPAR